jgi:xanthine/CO dehydrogenase XdhC/CoxF family maturation factor
LVEADRTTLGVLSGGCLEEEIGRYGRHVINDGSAVLLSFDTRRVYGCDGRLKILVEPLPAAGQNGNLITEVGRLLALRDVCRIRTCFEGGPLGSELPDSTSAAKHLKKSRSPLHPRLLQCFPTAVGVFCESARATFTRQMSSQQGAKPPSSNATSRPEYRYQSRLGGNSPAEHQRCVFESAVSLQPHL